MLKYAYNMLVYGSEPLDLGIQRIAKYGYDFVEVVGEPTTTSIPFVQQALAENNIGVSTVISIFTPERDLVSSNESIRENTIKYLKSNIDFAVQLGAKIVTLTPTACMKIRPEVAREIEWDWAVAGALEAASYAKENGVRIAVEPWNRYESYLINRLDQSIDFCKQVDSSGIGVMADTFHMAIEDSDIPAAITRAGKSLIHVHLADSNRAAPGRGHLNFTDIVRALNQIDYKGVCSFELLPAAGDVWGVLSGDGAEEFKDQYTYEAITHMKKIESELGIL
jgi:sugar phosphate isomerase/epimerase